jgi:hypothetical protein
MSEQQRQATLAKHFYFVCECERCQNEESGTEKYKCANAKCNCSVVKSMPLTFLSLVLPPTTSVLESYRTFKGETAEEAVCDTCGKTVASEEITNALHRANQLQQQAQSLHKDASHDQGHCLELYGKSLSIFRHTLHPYNPELMAHLDEAMSACIGTLTVYFICLLVPNCVQMRKRILKHMNIVLCLCQCMNISYLFYLLPTIVFHDHT